MIWIRNDDGQYFKIPNQKQWRHPSRGGDVFLDFHQANRQLLRVITCVWCALGRWSVCGVRNSWPAISVHGTESVSLCIQQRRRRVVIFWRRRLSRCTASFINNLHFPVCAAQRKTIHYCVCNGTIQWALMVSLFCSPLVAIILLQQQQHTKNIHFFLLNTSARRGITSLGARGEGIDTMH